MFVGTTGAASRVSSSTDFSIRHAHLHELDQLPEIERRAGERFAQIAELVDAPADLTPLSELQAAHAERRVWVVAAPAGEIVGFAYAAVIDAHYHLEELDVLPEVGRRGLGAALVRAVRESAAAAGVRGVTLTTYRDVPWNAPFYRRLGFRELDPPELTPGLAAAVADEARRGLDPEQRVVMVWRRPEV